MALVFVGIGSSIDRAKNIRLGIEALRVEFGALSISPVYESEAVGFKGCNFYNLVVSFTCLLDAQSIIRNLKSIEIQLGRPEKAVKYAPRTLDLDLLLYDNLIKNDIDLPRSEILTNAFVLRPLSELVPNLKHPILDETYQVLWDRYPQTKQKLWQIDAIIN